DAHHLLAADAKARLVDRALRAGLAWPVAEDRNHLAAEELDIEGHRLLRAALEHQERCDLRRGHQESPSDSAARRRWRLPRATSVARASSFGSQNRRKG